MQAHFRRQTPHRFGGQGNEVLLGAGIVIRGCREVAHLPFPRLRTVEVRTHLDELLAPVRRRARKCSSTSSCNSAAVRLARRSSSKLKYSSPSRGVPAAKRSANNCHSSVVLPARRGPITATALPLTSGMCTSRRVDAGAARLSMIFSRISSRISPSQTDTSYVMYPYHKDISSAEMSGLAAIERLRMDCNPLLPMHLCRLCRKSVRGRTMSASCPDASARHGAGFQPREEHKIEFLVAFVTFVVSNPRAFASIGRIAAAGFITLPNGTMEALERVSFAHIGVRL